jgi:hypothetical protein
MRVLTSVQPDEIRLGDEIVNVGVVSATRQDGVFTVVEALTTVWSTVTGRGRESVVTTTFHASQPVTVARNPREVTAEDAPSILWATSTLAEGGVPLTTSEKALRSEAVRVLGASQ